MSKSSHFPKIKFINFGQNGLHHRKSLSSEISFDELTQDAVIKCSICTGEQVAGFKNKTDGTFVEVMLIKNESDLEFFKKTYNIKSVRKEY